MPAKKKPSKEKPKQPPKPFVRRFPTAKSGDFFTPTPHQFQQNRSVMDCCVRIRTEPVQ